MKTEAKFFNFLGHTVIDKYSISKEEFNLTNLVVMDKFDIFDIPIIYFSKSSDCLEQFIKYLGKMKI